jgi:hypothetical protein
MKIQIMFVWVLTPRNLIGCYPPYSGCFNPEHLPDSKTYLSQQNLLDFLAFCVRPMFSCHVNPQALHVHETKPDPSDLLSLGDGSLISQLFRWI